MGSERADDYSSSSRNNASTIEGKGDTTTVANSWNTFDPGNLLLVLSSFVFTGSRVDDTTPKKYEHVFLAPVFASIILLKSTSRVQFSPSAHTRRDFFLH